MLSSPHDVVGGVYPKKSDELEFTACPEDGAEVDADGFLEMMYLPTGFLKISRACIEQMVKAYKHLEYYENCGGTGVELKVPCLFWLELMADSNGKRRMMGEDVSFCKKWRDIGGNIYADTTIEFAHFGPKAWRAKYSEHIPRRVEAAAA